MMCQVEFDYKKQRTILRYPKKEFANAGGEECVKRIQEKLKGVTIRSNSRYMYIDLPFNLMNGEVANEISNRDIRA